MSNYQQFETGVRLLLLFESGKIDTLPAGAALEVLSGHLPLVRRFITGLADLRCSLFEEVACHHARETALCLRLMAACPTRKAQREVAVACTRFMQSVYADLPDELRDEVREILFFKREGELAFRAAGPAPADMDTDFIIITPSYN